jgi:hypothetical protein
MLLADGVLGMLLVGLWIFCIIDVITTDEVLIRNLQKPLWLLIVIFLFDLGAILWLIAGRPWEQSAARRPAASGPASAFPEYDRPGRFAATNPDDDEDFLRQVRERAEEQRRRYGEQQKEQLRREEQAEQQRHEKHANDDTES